MFLLAFPWSKKLRNFSIYVWNSWIFANFADGDIAVLDFPNDIASLKTGKNGNSIYGLNETGKQAELKLKLIRGSSDDKYMLNLISQQQANFAGFPLMTGEFVKKIGDGTGKIANDTYITSGGIFTKIPAAKSNVEGDTEQSTVTYTIKFSNAPRILT